MTVFCEADQSDDFVLRLLNEQDLSFASSM